MAHSYAYDAAGNIVSNSKLASGAPYSYGRMYGDPSAPYHAVKWVGSHFYEYDARGNLKLAYENSGCAVNNTKAFLWDTENRLKQVTAGSVGVKFAYDAGGERIKKASSAAAGGATTRFFGRYAEIESQGTTRTRTRYVYLGSQLVAKKTQAIDASGAGTGASDTVWFHADHLTSTRLMTDATGAKVAHYDYAIFGEKTHESGAKAAANQKGFTSHEHDDELGLIYMKARYYDPVLGRFISPDSIIPEPGDPQSWNRYAYVRNNPFNAVDPTGHFDILGVTNVGTRSLGVVQAVGGASESALGGMVAVGGSATGVGAVPGVAAGSVLFAHGVDQAVAGFNTALTGEFQTSGTTQLLTGAGMDPTMAERTDQAISLVGGVTAAKSLIQSADDVARGGARAVEQEWKLGEFKSAAKWESQMAKRGWTPEQISEAIQKGEKFAAENLVNKGNAATRYVHPETGRSVVRDDVTKEVLHVGGEDFKY